MSKHMLLYSQFAVLLLPWRFKLGNRFCSASLGLNRLKWCKLILLLPFLIMFLWSTVPASAQSSDNSIRLSHSALTVSDLPAPGAPLRLTVTLLNSRDSQRKMVAMIVRDGKLLDVSLSELSSDENEQLVYSTSIPAPLGELSYQFFLIGLHGSITHSERYFVRRGCLPNIDSVDTSLGFGSNGRKPLDKLREQAARLQVEVQNYERAVKLLDELKIMTEKQ